jgi:hypothetical protein
MDRSEPQAVSTPWPTATPQEGPLTKEERIAWLLSQTIANSGKETFVLADFARDLVAYEELCRLDPENAEYQAGAEKGRATLEKIARAEAEGGWVSDEGPTTNYVPTKGVTYISFGERKEGYVRIPDRRAKAPWSLRSPRRLTSPKFRVSGAEEREEKELYKAAARLSLATEWLAKEEKRKQREAIREAMEDLDRERR